MVRNEGSTTAWADEKQDTDITITDRIKDGALPGYYRSVPQLANILSLIHHNSGALGLVQMYSVDNRFNVIAVKPAEDLNPTKLVTCCMRNN